MGSPDPEVVTMFQMTISISISGLLYIRRKYVHTIGYYSAYFFTQSNARGVTKFSDKSVVSPEFIDSFSIETSSLDLHVTSPKKIRQVSPPYSLICSQFRESNKTSNLSEKMLVHRNVRRS